MKEKPRSIEGKEGTGGAQGEKNMGNGSI